MTIFNNPGPEHYICTVNPNGTSLTSLTISILKSWTKALMQGRLFQRRTHFFVLYCTVIRRKSKHKLRGMSKPDMESIFTKIIYEIVWS